MAAAYANQRDRLKGLAKVAPDLAEQARHVIDATEAENKVPLDRMLAEEEARKEASGLADAERNWERTEEAEHEAAIDVCSYRCRTLEEAQIKAKYLASAPGLKDMWDEHVEALLQSFIGEAA